MVAAESRASCGREQTSLACKKAPRLPHHANSLAATARGDRLPAADTAIEGHWQSFVNASLALLVATDGEEEALDAAQTAAEHAILAMLPTTKRGSIIQIYVGLYHDVGFLPAPGERFPGSPGIREVEAAILAEDVASLDAWERQAMFDWGVRFLIRALVSLSQMEG